MDPAQVILVSDLNDTQAIGAAILMGCCITMTLIIALFGLFIEDEE